MNVIRTPRTSPMIERDANASTRLVRDTSPQYAPQAREPLSRSDLDTAHVMSCTKVGCLRCGS